MLCKLARAFTLLAFLFAGQSVRAEEVRGYAVHPATGVRSLAAWHRAMSRVIPASMLERPPGRLIFARLPDTAALKVMKSGDVGRIALLGADTPGSPPGPWLDKGCMASSVMPGEYQVSFREPSVNTRSALEKPGRKLVVSRSDPAVYLLQAGPEEILSLMKAGVLRSAKERCLAAERLRCQPGERLRSPIKIVGYSLALQHNEISAASKAQALEQAYGFRAVHARRPWLTAQIDAATIAALRTDERVVLVAADCGPVDKLSIESNCEGKSHGPPEYEVRFARTLADLDEVVRDLAAKGIHLEETPRDEERRFWLGKPATLLRTLLADDRVLEVTQDCGDQML